MGGCFWVKSGRNVWMRESSHNFFTGDFDTPRDQDLTLEI
jgi:hypothetical protein